MACTSGTSPVCLVHLVSLVYLVGLVYPVHFVQPNTRDRPNRPDKRDRPNRPNEQDRLAACFSILLVVEDDIEEGAVHMDATVVLQEAQLSELIHEKTYP